MTTTFLGFTVTRRRAWTILGLWAAMILGVSAQAYAREVTFWEMLQWYIEVFGEMCPVRHPFGHWGGHATAGLSALQWGLTGAGAAVAAVLLRRRTRV